jgi:CubicO group peptidase (beta-lactamase class C family)/transcriptional regulator GlxA family with amidase domain
MMRWGVPVLGAALLPLIVGVISLGLRMAELEAPVKTLAVADTVLPPLPAYDPSRPTAVVLFSARATEITDALPPFGVLAETGMLNVYAVAPDRVPAPLYNGMQKPAGLDVIPHLGFADYDALVGRRPDILVVPYFPGWKLDLDAEVVTWLRGQVGPDTRVVTVCAGTEIFAATGLLDGHRATSNPYWLKRLNERHPRVEWLRNRRYVADRRMFTSTTLTSGIDATLAAAADVLGRRPVEEAAGRLGYKNLHFLDDQSTEPARLTLTSVPGSVFRLGVPRVLVPLPDGTDEIALAAVLDLEAAVLDRTLAVAEGPVTTSRRGLHLRAAVQGSSIVAGAWRLSEAAFRDGVFPYDGMIRRLAERRGPAAAASISRSFAYPPPELEGTGPAIPRGWLWFGAWALIGGLASRGVVGKRTWVAVVVVTMWAPVAPVAGQASHATLAGARPSAWAAEPWRDWPESTPEEQGMSSGVLAEMIDWVLQSETPIHSILLVRHGTVVLDVVFDPFRPGRRHDLASVTKSVTSMVVGAAIQADVLPDPDVSVAELLTLPEVPPPPGSDLTLRHLLGMRSGLDCGYRPGEPELAMMRSSDDWAAAVFNLPRRTDAGTEFAYCSGNYHLLSAVLTAATGRSGLALAKEWIFDPLGIEDVVWPTDPRGVTHGWGDLQLRPRDAAKLGYLLLNDGVWNGRRILPEGWVAWSTTADIDAGPGNRYGYGWWQHPGAPAGYYEAIGRGGQRIGVWPAEDLVLVVTAGGAEPGDLGPYFVRAIQSDSPLPFDSIGQRNLGDRIRAALALPPRQAPAAPPHCVAARGGLRYRFANNAMGLREIQFDWKGVDPRVALAWSDVELDLPMGLDGRLRFAEQSLDGIAPGARASFPGPCSVQVEVDLVGKVDHYLIEIRFEGGGLQADVSERSRGTKLTLRADRSAHPSLVSAQAAPESPSHSPPHTSTPRPRAMAAPRLSSAAAGRPRYANRQRPAAYRHRRSRAGRRCRLLCLPAGR